MKRYIITILSVITFIFTIFLFTSNTTKYKNMKIGVIDTSISKVTLEEYNIKVKKDFEKEKVEYNNTHGAAILDIITKNANHCDIYYATALNCTLTGEINNVILSIDWCIKNDVDIICMSFATLKNDKNLEKEILKATENGIIIISSCINNSNLTCYPAMYDRVISVSEGSNPNAKIIIKDKSFNLDLNGKTEQWEGCSALTAYVCSKVANELSKGNNDIFRILEDIQEN